MEPNSDVIFTCVCNEPEGEVVRTVKLFGFTKENLAKLYERIQRFSTFMGYEINNFQDMLGFFIREETQGALIPKGLALVVDDFVGLFYLTDIIGLEEATVHYTFFDRRHKGRVEICKKALAYTFNHFQFHRLSTQVPGYAVFTQKFVESLGFVKEGKLRKNRLSRGKYYDTFVYGLLREEFKWEAPKVITQD